MPCNFDLWCLPSLCSGLDNYEKKQIIEHHLSSLRSGARQKCSASHCRVPSSVPSLRGETHGGSCSRAGPSFRPCAQGRDRGGCPHHQRHHPFVPALRGETRQVSVQLPTPASRPRSRGLDHSPGPTADGGILPSLGSGSRQSRCTSELRVLAFVTPLRCETHYFNIPMSPYEVMVGQSQSAVFREHGTHPIIRSNDGGLDPWFRVVHRDLNRRC